MSWHKLTTGNDWGNRFTLIGEKHMSQAGTWGSGDETTPFLDKPGLYRVRFPDGSEEVLTMEMRPYTECVYDMGHAYDVNGHEPFFIVTLHGQVMAERAAKLGVEVWRDD